MEYVSSALSLPYDIYKVTNQIKNMPLLRKRKHHIIPKPRKKPKTGFKNTRQGTKRGVQGYQTTMQPSLGGGKLTTSRVLSIGKSKRFTSRDKMNAINHPPQIFNSKWTFQMDCTSGRVTAATIPILNKPLTDPIFNQIFANAQTDVTPWSPLVNGGAAALYSVSIQNYVSNLKFYNSSSQSANCRLVWYKPRRSMNGTLNIQGLNLPSGPLNTLMASSNIAIPVSGSGIVPPTVGSGVLFDTSSPVTSGQNYTTNFEHAGWPITGTSTTLGSIANAVAYLDPSLVPGSKEVRTIFSQYWQALKSEDFMLEPGHQHNATLRIKNRMVKRGADDDNYQYFKNASVVGVLYVLGQIVFNDGSGGAGPTTDNAISTGSSQISVLREDTCTMQPLVVKKSFRLNLTSPFVVMTSLSQGIINDDTNTINNNFEQDL